MSRLLGVSSSSNAGGAALTVCAVSDDLSRVDKVDTTVVASDSGSCEAEMFSVDLVECSKCHRTFLRTLHQLGISQRRPSAKSVRRYRDLWLPLVAEYLSKGCDNSDRVLTGERIEAVGLVPPVDVAWLWHCHRLAPLRYVDYVKTISSNNGKENICDKEGLVLEADPPFALQHCTHSPEQCSGLVVIPSTGAAFAAATNARILWETMYPTEPFFLPPNDVCSEQSERKSRPTSCSESGVLGGFNLVASTDRQCTFLWQVSGLRFSDDSFLHDGVNNYEKFLRLRASPRGQSQIIVPTYQIDLMWHTHILVNIGRYEHDCKRILGHTLHHDDSLTDRSEGSSLDVAFKATKELWRETYGSDYCVDGGMFRGDPPLTYFAKDFFNENRASAVNPTGPFQDLIGKVGASSTNPAKTGGGHNQTTTIENRADGSTVTTVRTINPDGSTTVTASTSNAISRDSPGTPDTRNIQANWLNVSGVTPGGSPAFIVAAAKSTVRGQNNNDRRAGYVFGKGSLGAGYYYVTTKDASEILYKRLCVARQKKKGEVDCQACMTCFCFWDKTCKEQSLKKERELEEMDEMVAVAKARSEAEVPLGAVGMSTNNRRYRDFYSADGGWHLPIYFTDAAACGAEKISGGACAGGACGAAACGGGACGGGGCGGGGCGGGCGG